MNDTLDAIEQPTAPAVAICVPPLNHAEHLGEAVRGGRSGLRGSVDVWVSDDASTDEPPGVLAALPTEFSEVNLIIQTRNLGIAANASADLRAAITAYAVRLDSDDLLRLDFSRVSSRRWRPRPTPRCTHSGVVEIDERGHVGKDRRLVSDNGYLAAEQALREPREVAA